MANTNTDNSNKSNSSRFSNNGANKKVFSVNILYNGRKNQVARTLEELVRYMLEDRALAKQYLYSGMLSRWLLGSGYPELQIQIDELVNKRYPKNQEAGLMAVVYLLDANLPYLAPTGKWLSTNAEIARDMAGNAPDYLDLMVDPDSSLYVYFRSTGVDYAPVFVPVAKELRLKALWRMVFTLDPLAPFPLINCETRRYVLLDNIDAMVDFYAKQPLYGYQEIDSAYPPLLLDEAFDMWLRYRNPSLADEVKTVIRIAGEEKDGIYDFLFYNLDKTRNYFFEKDQSRTYTMAQIAELIEVDNMVKNGYECDDYECDEDQSRQRVNMFRDFYEKHSRLSWYIFTRDHDAYNDLWYEIFDTESIGLPYTYNVIDAFYKALKKYKADKKVRYYFCETGDCVSNVEEVDSIDADAVDYEMTCGELDAWLTVQYHEDPNVDTGDWDKYINLLCDYTLKLGQYDPNYREYKIFSDNVTKIDSNAKECRSLVKRVQTWRGVWVVLIALPLVLVSILSLLPGFTAESTTKMGVFDALVLTGALAGVIRLLLQIPKLHSYVYHCAPFKFADWASKHRWVSAFINSAAVVGLIWLLSNFGIKYGWIIMPVFALGYLYLSWRLCIKAVSLMTKEYSCALNPEYEEAIEEPLRYVWGPTQTEAFTSGTLEMQVVYINATGSELKRQKRRTYMSLLPVVILVAVYLSFSNHTPQWVQTCIERVCGIVDRTPDVVEDIGQTQKYYADVKSSLTVRAEPSKDAASLGNIPRNGEMQVVSIDDGFAKIIWGDGYGYVSAKYIKSGAAPNPVQTNEVKAPAAQPAKTEKPASSNAIPLGTYTIRSNYTYVTLYSRPESHTSAMVCDINKGETFEVIDAPKNSEFAKVIYNGETGYVMRTLIQKAD